jgi:quercetin dioxygenase-like cupin family protein
MSNAETRFVTSDNMVVEELPWGPHEWLCRPDIVAAEKLLLVRVRMPVGKAHEFHRHPEMEEIIYIEEGLAEQWVDREKRLLGPGDSAHIPTDIVHGTYNAGDATLVFLAILSPAKIEGPPLIDVSQDEPWKSLRSEVTGKFQGN